MELEEGDRKPTPEVGLGSSADLSPPVGASPEHIEADSRDYFQALSLLKEPGVKLTEELLELMPKLLSSLKQDDPVVVRQSIANGTSLFSAVLEEMALQLQKSGKVEGWLEEMWNWMVQFKDAVSGIVLEPGSVGIKVLALKFLEICVLLFTSDENDNGVLFMEGKGPNFNASWLVPDHPILNPALLAVEADKTLGLLLDVLQSADTLRGSFTVAIIICLSVIAKNRPLHYNCILSALLGIDHNFDTLKGGHAASIRYSLRTAFLGFLRCTHPAMLESKEKLTRALKEMYPREATDQVILQSEKMSKRMERGSRDIRLNKDDLPSRQMSACGDLTRKRPVVEPNNSPPKADDMPAKRIRFDTSVISTHPAQVAYDLQDDDDADDDANNESSTKPSLMDNNLTPAEKMIAMIGALLAEGERGAESVEILISNFPPDLLADVVIETMKHLPKSPFGSPTVSSQIGSAASASVSVQSAALASQLTSTVGATVISMSTSDTPSFHNALADSKRDPRRDPRRLDPRRSLEPIGQHSVTSNLEYNNEMQSGIGHSLSKPVLSSEFISKLENSPVYSMPKKEPEPSESSIDPLIDQLTFKESLEVLDNAIEAEASAEVHTSSELALSPVQELAALNQSDITANEGVDADMLESDQSSSLVSTTLVSEDTCHDLPMLPLYVDLTDEQKKACCKLAVTRIIEGYKQFRATGCGPACLPLLARLVAQTDADGDIITMLLKHIISDYHHQKGHELAMHILYHLRTVMITELDEHSSSFAANNYETFFLSVAKALLDSLPASDKSFSRLLGEAPFLPDTALRLLEDLCHSRCSDHNKEDICDGDRITQGLGALWSLILGRPLTREACLNIALKCTVHSLDEVRAKAIRLVANKLYLLNYASENIERFARSMLLSVVDQQEVEVKPAGSSEQKIEVMASLETSVSSSQNSEPGASESESAKGIQTSSPSVPPMSLSHAQRQTSLFFALCTKKPNLLRTIFDIYGRAPKAVKQSVHRHVPVLVRTVGSSYTELLHIISDPPEGSENLVMLVLKIMTEESTPSSELIAAVKHLYETKLKDAAILIPMLSSLSKDEVLPIFPRLIDLPLEKFVAALARILQGSAHTGPALTPVEVLVAIHDIVPEKDGVALKKITDACTACFEQRTVFTQHVLAKSLSHLVDQAPLPLLFMRTVIQAIDAFPALVDFVMEILSKLVSKQIWKMPKLWVGFLKCASQTQPRSFHVLLQLPPPQLENALSRHTNLRGPLAAFANQSSTRSSLSRPTLRVLGLVNEPQQSPRSYLPAAMHTSDASSSSVHSATLT